MPAKSPERAAAKEAGETYYSTGKPCRRGHITKRRVSDQGCVECSKLTRDAWLAANRNRSNAKRQIARKKPEIVAKERAYNKAYEAQPEIKKRRAASLMRRYHENPDRFKAQVAAWRKANPDYVSVVARVAKAKRRSKAPGDVKASDVQELLRIQKFKCAICLVSVRKKYHVDHIMPVALGGVTERSNLQILCPTCNMRKGAKHPIDFALSQGRLA